MSETPVLDLLAKMTSDSVAASTLDARGQALVRLAALVASDAPPIAYVHSLGDAGLTIDDAQGVLIALAPIVGTARVMTAAGNMARALGVAVAIVEAGVEEALAKYA